MAAPVAGPVPLLLALLLAPLLLEMPTLASARPEDAEKQTEERAATVKAGKLIKVKERLLESDVEMVDSGLEPVDSGVEPIGEDIVRGDGGEGRQYWSPDCPDGFEKYWSLSGVVSICFHVSQRKLKWSEARDACERLAPRASRCFATLASVLNRGENARVRDLMRAMNVRDHVWIGLNDRVDEGYYSWLDGRGFDYSNFYRYEPNNGGVPANSYEPGEDCVELMYGHGNQWNDRSCDDEKYYACKAYCV